MVKKAAGYLAVLLITAYLFLMYNDAILSAVLVLELLYPVLSLLSVHWMKKRISIGIGKVPPMGEKDKNIRIKIWIKNSSRLWNVKYKAKLCIGNRFCPREVRKQITGMAENALREEQTFSVSSSYCGRLEISLDSLLVYDFLGIFFGKVRIEDTASIGILPKFELMPLEITRRTREFLADADEHSVEKSGDDPAEIYQIRKYRPRDSVHDIHWKLTAKADELMVKEHGFPLGCVVLLWLDVPDKGKSAAGFDRMLEQAASLSMTLAQEKCIHMAAWFDEKDARVVKYKVNSEEAAYELVWTLLDMEPYKDAEMAQIAYEDAFLGEHFSSIAVIDGQGDIKVNGRMQEFLQL